MSTLTKRNKKAASAVSTELLLAFGYVAGKIVDTQIDWEPGQTGRWDVSYLPDGKTPRIRFSLFPEGTILTLRSVTDDEVQLGLEAAALAISECAMNWVSHQAYEAGKHHIGEAAALLYYKLHRYIWQYPEVRSQRSRKDSDPPLQRLTGNMKRNQPNPNECFQCGKPVATDQPGSIRWDYKDSPVYCDPACWGARRAEQEKIRLWITALHEAGHCLGVRLGGRKVKTATIVPSKKCEGCVSHEIDIHQPYPTEYQMEEWLLGHAAEVEFGFTGGMGHDYDYEHAAELLKAPIKSAKSEAWAKRTGIWGRVGNRKHTPYSTWDIRPRYSYVNGEQVNHVNDWKRATRVTKAEWKPEFDRYVRKARRLAKKYREWIEAVAKLLLEKRTLTDEDIPPL